MCPLKIDDSWPGFAAMVVSALSTIAPGYRFWVDEWAMVNRAGVDCARYRRHRAGCNLVAAVTKPASPPLLLEPTSVSHGSEWVPGKVSWCPWHDRLKTNACGTTHAFPALILAHELVHAYRSLEGHVASSFSDDEAQTCAGENQVRGELCEPSRAYYGTSEGSFPIRVQPRQELPDDDRECCGEGSPAEEQAVSIECKKRIEAQCVLYQTKAAEPRPSPPPDLGPLDWLSDVDLKARFRLAYESRAESDDFARLEAWFRRPGIEPPRATLQFESAGLAGGCGVVGVEVLQGGGLTITSNLRFQDGESLFAEGPFQLLRHTVDPSQAPRVLDFVNTAAPRGLKDVPDLGGYPEAFDGAAKFLTLETETLGRHMGLHGYSFPAFNPTWNHPEGPDGERWQAIDDALHLVRDLVTNWIVEPGTQVLD